MPASWNHFTINYVTKILHTILHWPLSGELWSVWYSSANTVRPTLSDMGLLISIASTKWKVTKDDRKKIVKCARPRERVDKSRRSLDGHCISRTYWCCCCCCWRWWWWERLLLSVMMRLIWSFVNAIVACITLATVSQLVDRHFITAAVM